MNLGNNTRVFGMEENTKGFDIMPRVCTEMSFLSSQFNGIESVAKKCIAFTRGES
jgi:hypothetical protein